MIAIEPVESFALYHRPEYATLGWATTIAISVSKGTKKLKSAWWRDEGGARMRAELINQGRTESLEDWTAWVIKHCPSAWIWYVQDEAGTRLRIDLFDAGEAEAYRAHWGDIRSADPPAA